jgi:hypothetical protein
LPITEMLLSGTPASRRVSVGPGQRPGLGVRRLRSAALGEEEDEPDAYRSRNGAFRVGASRASTAPRSHNVAWNPDPPAEVTLAGLSVEGRWGNPDGRKGSRIVSHGEVEEEAGPRRAVWAVPVASTGGGAQESGPQGPPLIRRLLVSQQGLARIRRNVLRPRRDIPLALRASDGTFSRSATPSSGNRSGEVSTSGWMPVDRGGMSPEGMSIGPSVCQATLRNAFSESVRSFLNTASEMRPLRHRSASLRDLPSSSFFAR